MRYRTLACALFCLTSCGGSNATPDAPHATIDSPPVDAPADACATSAQIRCEKLQTCSPADLSKRFGDLTTCEAREGLTCTEALAAPATAQTDTTVLACADAIGAETCSDFFDKAPPPACTTPLGAGSAACGFAAQCATGFCNDGTEAVCGDCAAQPAVGDSCATSTCGQDLICVAATETCQVPVGSGSACSKDLPCADGFTCVGIVAAPPTDGACEPEIATAGSACDAKHKTLADCSGDDGLTCDTTTNLCIAQPLAAAGSACGSIAGVRTACLAGATCVTTGSGSDATSACVAPAGDGNACDTLAGPGCLTPAKCVPTSGSGTAGSCELPGSTSCE